MSQHCRLDRLPVELLHTLFAYFSAHEILLIFSDVSKYINDVLATYSAYHLNLSLISKADLTLIRDRLSPKQIISLTLSDNDNTLVASEIFLSYFRLEHFSRLRSLILIQTDIQTVKSIFSVLHTLKHLRFLSFDIDTIRHRYPAWNGDHANGLHQLEAFLSDSHTRVFPRLTQIDLNSSIDLLDVPLPNLCLLKLAQCSFDDLKIIFRDAPQLRSLDLHLNRNHFSNNEFILPANHLRRLTVEIEHQRISRKQIEEFLSHSSHLKQLILKAQVWEDVTDGHFWQDLAKTFVTLHFKLHTWQINVWKALASFQTPFWLEQKRWYVAYQYGFFFTLPYFAPEHMESLGLSHFCSTAPDRSLFFHRSTKFTVTRTPFEDHSHRHRRIKTLILEHPVSVQALEKTMDLGHIKHLIIPSIDQLLALIPLQSTMPQLNKLTIKNPVTMSTIERIQHHHFAQVRTLQIGLEEKDTDYIMEELFLMFNRVEHVICKSPVQSVDMMTRFMDGFDHLSKASFCAGCSFYRKESQFCRDPNFTTFHSRRYTCQVYHLTNTHSPMSIHFTVEARPTTALSWRWKHHWYRFKYMALQMLNNHFILLSCCIEFLVFLFIVVTTHLIYQKFDMPFCLMKAVFITVVYKICQGLFSSIKSDRLYDNCIHRVYLWFIFSLIVFSFSFFGQMLYDTNLQSVQDLFV